MEILPFVHSDLPFLAELQPSGWPDILPHFDYYVSSSFCFPMKIMIGDKIVGIGTTIVRDETAWLAHIIVHLEFRNKGIGWIITRFLMDSLHTIRCETVYLIATDLGYPLYQKMGFVTETEYASFKTIPSKYMEGISHSIIPFEEYFTDQLIEMDNFISGENRTVQLKEHILHAIIYHTNKKLEGFYLPTWHEGLILASNFEAGSGLMRVRWKHHDSSVLPIDNRAGIRFLEDHHFEEIKKAKKMRFGKKRDWKPSLIYNRINGSMG